MEFQIRHPKDNREIKVIIDLMKECFPRMKKDFFKKRILGDPCYNRNHTYLLVKDNQIICHAQLFKKHVYFFHKQLMIFGLGFICTAAKYRNHGYCKKLLEKVITDTEKKGAAFIILFTRIPKFYSKFGFLKAQRQYYLIERAYKNINIFSIKNSFKILRFSFHKDISQVHGIYADFFSQKCCAAKRRISDWAHQLSYFNEDKKLFLVFEQQGIIKAYIRCKRGEREDRSFIEIVEFASRRGNNFALIVFIKYLFDSNGVDYIILNSVLADQDLRTFFKLRCKNDPLLMYKLSVRKARFSRFDPKEIAFLESDSF